MNPVQRLFLIFPPLAAPTYVPLGIHTLKSWLNRVRPQVEVICQDANILLWNSISPMTAIQIRESGRFLELGAEYDSIMETWASVHRQLSDTGERLSYLLSLKDQESADFQEALETMEQLLEPVLVQLPQVEGGILFGFSCVFLDQISFALSLSSILRKRYPGSRIIMGGAAMSALHNGEELVNSGLLDALVTGEGEIPLAAMLAGEDWHSIPGVLAAPRALQGGSEQILSDPLGSLPGETATIPPLLMESIPPPDFSQVRQELYWWPEPVFPAVMSRNCQWGRYRFCAHNFSFSTHRVQTAGSFVSELEQIMAQTGARHFYLADQFVPAGVLEQISDEILDRGLNIRFQIMGRCVRDYTPEILEKAARAGCVWISWGLETGSARLMRVAGKGTSPATAALVMQRAARAGIHNLAMMIFGLPTTTDDDLEETFELADRLEPWVRGFTASSFVLFRHTPFALEPDRYGIVPGAQEVILRIGDRPLLSTRTAYEVMESGALCEPAGPREVMLWNRRRAWTGASDRMIAEKLCAEHYLLWASRNPAVDHNPDDHPTGPESFGILFRGLISAPGPNLRNGVMG